MNRNLVRWRIIAVLKKLSPILINFINKNNKMITSSHKINFIINLFATSLLITYHKRIIRTAIHAFYILKNNNYDKISKYGKV